MATYEYECEKTGRRFELFQKGSRPNSEKKRGGERASKP